MPRVVELAGLAVALAAAAIVAQTPVEQAVGDLASPNRNQRLRAVRLLKETAAVEWAVPLAPLVLDAEDVVQAEAIAAELNTFLANRIVPRRRIGLVIEVRQKIAAEAMFAAGSSVLGTLAVPAEVLTALRTAAHDDNPFVATEALYAFGVLSDDLSGDARRALLRGSVPDLAAMLGMPDPALRLAAVRVMERLFASRPHDDPPDQVLGDAMIVVLNDRESSIRVAAMDALGAMRYERAVQALTDLFAYYRRGPLREAALASLARIGHAASGPLFAEHLADRTAALRAIAIEGLARTGDRARESEIQTVLATERDARVSLAGRFALALLSRAGIDPLADALRRPDLRERALGYLAELAPGRAAEMGRFARDPDPQMRAAIAGACALSGDPASIAIVEPMSRDTDPTVARAAQRALTRLGAAPRGAS